MTLPAWAPLVSVASLAIAFLAFRISRRNSNVERRADARNEAAALAEIRGEKIVDLEKLITEVATTSRHELDKANEKIGMLEKVMEKQREDAAETQRLLVINFRAAMLKLLAHLEAEPVEVEPAVSYIRSALNGDAPTPKQRRTA